MYPTTPPPHSCSTPLPFPFHPLLTHTSGLSEIISRGYRARIREQPSQVKVQASLQHRCERDTNQLRSWPV